MMMSFGTKIRELRVKRGLTQLELAEKMNEKFNTAINKGMISKWENNLIEPKLETAGFFALFFNVSLDELLGIKKDEEDWTEEELESIEEFKEFVRSKRRDKR